MAYSHQAHQPMILHRTHHARAGALAMPRRRGAGAGTLLVLLGIWGALVPFIGPMFNYSWDTAGSWAFTWDRLWLNILPGAAAIIGGLVLIGAADRLSAVLGSWLAIAGGGWFLVGPSVSLLWGSPAATTGIGSGSAGHRFIEQIGFFYGLGFVVTALAAGALARVLVRSERDALLLESAAAPAETTETADVVRRDDVVADDGIRADRPAERVYRDEPERAYRGEREGRRVETRDPTAAAGGVAADVPPGGGYAPTESDPMTSNAGAGRDAEAGAEPRERPAGEPRRTGGRLGDPAVGDAVDPMAPPPDGGGLRETGRETP